MNLTLSQKLLLGVGGLAAVLMVMGSSSSASAATPVAGGAGGGGNATTPNAGDKLLVVTSQTGDIGRLYIRAQPGTSSPQVALAQHGETLTATGQVQAASDGTVWWQVKNSAGVVGWSESNFLQDMGQ